MPVEKALGIDSIKKLLNLLESPEAPVMRAAFVIASKSAFKPIIKKKM